MMKQKKIIPSVLLLMLFSMFLMFGSKTVQASQYYYFTSPAENSTFKAGNKISVSFYAGVVIKETKFDAWGNPSEVIYQDMPVTFKVFKGSTELYSKELTYQKGTTLTVSFIPNTTGTLKLCIYGRNMGLNVTSQTLQDTRLIKVKAKSPAAVKKIKPAVTVERTAKKKAVISCSNDLGFGMKVYRSAKKKGKYKLVKTVKKNTFTDKKIAGTKVYYYKVRLFAKKGKKIYLSKWSAPQKAAKYVPSADTSVLKVKVANTTRGVKVSWKKYSKAGYYLVSRATSSKGEGEVLTCNGKDEITFTDNTAAKGKTYYYTVTAWYGNDSKPLVKSKAIKIAVK